MKSPRLSWTLLVVTYRRPEILALTVRLAVTQSRPPLEVVIVDAGDDWEEGRARIEDELAKTGFNGPLIYQRAAVLGIPAQRNQGIAHASGDVIFLLDNDSLLYAECAERVMEVYEADVEERVTGVGLVHVGTPPPGSPSSLTGDLPVRGSLARLDRFVEGLSWRGYGFFLPYDREFPATPVPAACARLGAVRAQALDGFRMTFRRSVFESIRFEEMLQYQALSEDHDLSYRASRLGALVELGTARVHHAVAPGGRLSPQTLATLRWCNRIALHMVHGTERGRAAKRLLAALPFHLGVFLCQDLVKGDALLPRTRGLLAALPRSFWMLFVPAERIRRTHPSFQARLLRRDLGDAIDVAVATAGRMKATTGGGQVEHART